ncbi:LamG-like jellyroll fold domain-containing protein, partial [Oxobacter pfennigii]|uniref:LamG-like jellyroll fold domain-containing protein n=1 Tax=Oxobacter pfennigii TaxID=36849 RepID=UPI000AFEACAF
NGSTRHWYTYDSAGNLGYHDDIVNGVKYRYVYDLANRLSEVRDNKGNRTIFGYDPNNNGNRLYERLNKASYITSHGYSKDNRPAYSIYSRYLLNDGKVEYFPLNIDGEGTKGSSPTSLNGIFDKDKDSKQSLLAYESSTNLVAANSSFEKDLVNNDIPDWANGDWDTGGTGRWRLANDGVDGGRCIECYDSDNLTNGSITNAAAYQKVILSSVLPAAKEYIISAYAKRIGSTHPKLSIICLDSNEVQIPNAYWTYDKNIEENQWERISEKFTAPAGTKIIYAIIRAAVKDRDIVRFDAVQLEDSPVITPYTASTSVAAKILYNLGINRLSGTLGIWFYTTRQNTVRMIISSEGTAGQIFNMYINESNRLVLNARNNAGGTIFLATSPGTISLNTWHFAALKWNYSGSMFNTKLYIDGTFISGNQVSDFKDFSGGTTSIGSTIFGNSQLNGGMQHFMYSDSELADSEINNIFSRGRGYDVSYKYDSLGRLIKRTLSMGGSQYVTGYEYTPGTGGSTTTRLKSINMNGGVVSYTYDANGNIAKATIADGRYIEYFYDELNQLKRENNQIENITTEYTYNIGGNILTRTEYPFTTGDVGTPLRGYSYAYEEPDWKDLLTKFNGKTITYDNIGNPLIYDGWNFTWEEGRQLKSMVKSGTNISFKYNDRGIRTEKT